MKTDKNTAVFTRERVLTVLLALLTLITIYVCYLIVEPFIPAIAFALALAVATRGPYTWLRAHVKFNDAVAAGLATVLVALLIIGPAALLTTYIVQNAIENAGALQSGTSGASVLSRLEELPAVGGYIAEYASRFKIEEQIGSFGRVLASHAGGVLSSSVTFVTQLGITLFVLFFLYRDRRAAMAALRGSLPLSTEEADDLFERVGDTISATVNGSLTVALVQATLAGIVYVSLGVPGAVLWAAVTFFMALIPVLGTFLVWAPIALWLALSGHVGKALFLVVWGGAVVGSIDNLLYPYLVGGKLRLHTVPTFFSVIGGVALFGPVGLILGPMVVAVTIALSEVWFQRTEHGKAAEEAVARDASEPDIRPGEMMQEKN